MAGSDDEEEEGDEDNEEEREGGETNLQRSVWGSNAWRELNKVWTYEGDGTVRLMPPSSPPCK